MNSPERVNGLTHVQGVCTLEVQIDAFVRPLKALSQSRNV